MELVMVGLGRMGMNMLERLARDGHTVYGFDTSPEKAAEVVKRGGVSVTDLGEAAAKFTQATRIFWIMVPQGKPVDDTIEKLKAVLSPGDIIIDGGNSYFKDTVRRGGELETAGLHYIDCGTSGGVWGLKEGYCLMMGGDEASVKIAEPIFKSLAPENGYVYTGASGSGHYVKMVHNGIEYGMLQSYGEGFDILHASEYKLDLTAIASAWRFGSVVRSWLLDLLVLAFKNDTNLEHIRGYVEDSGEGRWTIQEAIDHNVPAPVITASLFERFHSRENESFAAKVIASLRNEFGGHAVKSSDANLGDATGSGAATVNEGTSSSTADQIQPGDKASVAAEKIGARKTA
ncbi:phosphogluconate dehydrogenase (NAD(+)-dependent, decarboxylating) [Capsulimonas corticalis]|nr:decarboxylating 6-phosphogluconate dehydrogenase [Capsulimonas corticalis]